MLSKLKGPIRRPPRRPPRIPIFTPFFTSSLALGRRIYPTSFRGGFKGRTSISLGTATAAMLLFFFTTFSQAAETTLVKIQDAHGLQVWKQTQVLACSLSIAFGGKTTLAGALYFETQGPRTRLELTSGDTLIFDGKTAWLSPETSALQRGRFHSLTWSWFLAIPFKLGGRDSRLTPFKTVTWDLRPFLTSVLTFAPGTGDTPDDWYYLYVDAQTHLLRGMGYIVTYGKSKTDAEQNPHGIIYEDYRDIEGVHIATLWRFGQFSEADGISGDIGSAKLSAFRFLKPGQVSFDKPPRAKEATKP